MPEEFDDSPIDNSVDYSDATYTYDIPGGAVTVITEFIPYKNSINTSGRQLVVYTHPQHGTSTFYIEQDKDAVWISEKKPAWLTTEDINDIGCKLEARC